MIRLGGPSRRSFSPIDDHYSGITALENIRDRGISPGDRFSRGRDPGFGRSLSPLRESRDRYGGGSSRDRDRDGGKPHLMMALRVVTALEGLLGSLAPQIDVIMARWVHF